MSELRTGTVTFLFTDIEGSTRLAMAHAERWPPLLERHHAIIREVVEQFGESVHSTEGDGSLTVFDSAQFAIAAAVEMQRRMASEQWPEGSPVRVRIGLHTGDALPSADGRGYAGVAIHVASRVAAVGSGGQIVVSEATRGLVAGALPAGARLRDLGAHRLKDLDQPLRLHDVVVDGLLSTFPPLRSAGAVSHLPAQVTRFLGRDREVRQVADLLADARLVTLTGPGGTGKTRLSLEVARRVADRYDGGAHFVDLSPLTDPSLVAGAIAHRLELPDRGGPDPIQRLVERFADVRTLLVLDNFEQILDAAAVVRDLLAGAEGLTVLVTSRSALRLYGEREYAVPPLAVPDPANLPALGALSQYEAVALFIERAVAVHPDFAITNENAPAIAEICVRLDGLPLAIELAAARIRHLTPQAILDRIEHRLGLLSGGSRDLPARQQTLRGAIAWSHDMLDQWERDLFASLAVFVDGADLPMIEALCLPGGGAGDDILEPLASLVDKSLVRQSDIGEQPRFSMLETIREFAGEQLQASGMEAQLRARHAELFAALADEARGQLISASSRAWLDRLEAEHGNIRAALAHAMAEGRAEVALRIVGGVWRFWQRRGYIAEQLPRAEQAVDMPGAPDHPAALMRGLEAAGGLAYWLGDQPRASRLYDRWIELARRTGDRASEAEALYSRSFTDFLGMAVRDERARAAKAVLDDALRLWRELGDRHGMAKALWALSNVEVERMATEPARRYAIEAIEMLGVIDDAFLRGWATFTVGLSYAIEHKPPEAIRWFKDALRTFIDAADVSGYTLVVDSLAMVVLRAGDPARAAWLAGAAAALERATGTGLNSRNREYLDWDPGALRDAPATAASWAEGEAASVPQVIQAALDL